MWFDEWEITPGDSIVKKVFDEGIEQSNVFIVVLSHFSVNKPWVREELDVGVIKRINEGSRIIPIVIDSCEIPTALQATHWLRIDDLNSYEEQLDRIVMAIFGHSSKPAVGSSPVYASTSLDVVPGLTWVDSLVLKLSVEIAIEEEQGKHIDVPDVIERALTFEVPEDEVLESLEVLDRNGYHIEAKLSGGGRRYHYFEITTYGFEEYARVYLPDYEDLIMSVASQIINYDKKNNKEIYEAVKQPKFIIDSILDVMKARGWIRIAYAIGGWRHVSEVSAEMKRALKNR